jgi:hypothetical protein
MRVSYRCVSSTLFALLFAAVMAFGQAQRQSTTLVVNGKSGQVPVV